MMKKCKYLFICGAVASGIGKGVINSSIGMLLKECGYNVTLMKIDPYLVLHLNINLECRCWNYESI